MEGVLERPDAVAASESASSSSRGSLPSALALRPLPAEVRTTTRGDLATASPSPTDAEKARGWSCWMGACPLLAALRLRSSAPPPCASPPRPARAWRRRGARTASAGLRRHRGVVERERRPPLAL